MDDIKNELREIQKSIKSIDITLGKQEVSLAEHIRRTGLLEEKIQPVEAHLHRVNGVLKFIGLLSLIAGFFAALVKIFN